MSKRTDAEMEAIKQHGTRENLIEVVDALREAYEKQCVALEWASKAYYQEVGIIHAMALEARELDAMTERRGRWIKKRKN